MSKVTVLTLYKLSLPFELQGQSDACEKSHLRVNMSLVGSALKADLMT